VGEGHTLFCPTIINNHRHDILVLPYSVTAPTIIIVTIVTNSENKSGIRCECRKNIVYDDDD
jgi:hypothetical protein